VRREVRGIAGRGVERNDECIKGQKRDRQKREKGEARREARGGAKRVKTKGGGRTERRGEGGREREDRGSSEAREGKIVFIRGLKLKRSEKTAIRKPAKWRRPTKGRLDLFIFFLLPPAEGRD